MSIGPILPGRLPASLMAARLREDLQREGHLLAHLREQLASGQKFFLPSEAPAAAVRTIALQKTIERKEQMLSNIGTSRSLLNASETALASVSDALFRSKALVLAGVGDSATPETKQALADEAASLLTQALSAANTKFGGRYLFGGSQSQKTPFDLAAGAVRYNGDGHKIASFADLEVLLANNVDGKTAFAPTTTPVGTDVNPALTFDTRIADLNGGAGVPLGSIVVTVTGGPPQTIDLSGAETVGDLKTILENAFGGSLAVNINAAANGLELDASGAGTVAVADVAGSTVAAELGIAGAAAATINGADLNPRLTLLTKLSALNGATGIAATPGQGLLITNGAKTQAVDISAAVTVEDLFNTLKLANLDLDVGINDAGNGLAISSRLSGVAFSIGENGDTTAADLGIRTFGGGNLLEDLNLGAGVPVDQGTDLKITRRDGVEVSFDLSGMKTVQQVLDAINADPFLTATLNGVGNGITIDDTSAGGGPLIIPENAVSTALGIAGEQAGPGPLVGWDVNQREARGVLSIFVQLEQALRTGDNAELQRLDRLIDEEVARFNLVRGNLGSQLRVLDEIENRLLDEGILLHQTLSLEFDADLTEVITRVTQSQATLDATLRVAASTLQLSLLSYL